jgi:hypothetical protein
MVTRLCFCELVWFVESRRVVSGILEDMVWLDVLYG